MRAGAGDHPHSRTDAPVDRGARARHRWALFQEWTEKVGPDDRFLPWVGFSVDDWELLREALLSHIREHHVATEGARR